MPYRAAATGLWKIAINLSPVFALDTLYSTVRSFFIDLH
jgi:hypothetical protein